VAAWDVLGIDHENLHCAAEDGLADPMAGSGCRKVAGGRSAGDVGCLYIQAAAVIDVAVSDCNLTKYIQLQ
jgi:hypothetical protein